LYPWRGLPGPNFFLDVIPEDRAERLQWEAWKHAGKEGWAREFLRQRLGNQEIIRRFLMQALPAEKKDDKGPGEQLYEAWLAGGRKSLEAEYDRMYAEPAKTQK
jgi:hypothetical protein